MPAPEVVRPKTRTREPQGTRAGFITAVPHTGFCTWRLPSGGTGPLREQEDRASLFQKIQDGAQSGGTHAITVDGHGVERSDQVGKDGDPEERLPGEGSGWDGHPPPISGVSMDTWFAARDEGTRRRNPFRMVNGPVEVAGSKGLHQLGAAAVEQQGPFGRE